MSSSSLASWASDGANTISTTVSQSQPPSLSTSRRPHKFFDKCPQCRMQYDFLRRANSASSKVPLVLLCKHTICEDCIRKLCLASNTACPVCNERFIILRNQLDSITEIFTPHYSLIGYLMWAKNSPGRRQMNWVSTGQTLKSKQAPGMDDVNMEGEDGSDEDSVDGDFDRVVLSMEFERCPEHNDGYLNIHCEDCNNTVCCYCYVERHGGHQPLYLYRLADQEMAELQQSKIHMELVLKQLQKSQKKSKQLKTFDLTTIETDIKGCFAEMHAKLHLAERNIRKKLTTIETDETDMGSINSRIKSAIWRVTQVLEIYNMMASKKQINVRALYEEVQDLKGIPCRLISDCGVLEPVEFVVKDPFDNIEESFTLKKLPGLEYSLLPIEDWTCEEEDSQPEASRTTHSATTVHDRRSEARHSSESTTGFNDNRLRKSSSGEVGKTKIIVTHLNNLDSFYVQKYSVLPSLKQMNKNIEKRAKRKLSSDEIVQGRVYGVLYETKNAVHWRRGKLVDIVKKGSNDFLYSMFFIDYGNTQCVTKDKLRELDYHVVKRLPFAFECKLTNPDNVTFDANAHLRLPQIIGEKELFLHFTNRQNNGVQEVDLLIPSSNGNAVSVRDILQQKSTINEKEEILVSKQLKLFKNSKKFALGQEEEIVVSYVKDPFHICVLQVRNTDAIEKMRHDMAVFYEHCRAISCIPAQGTDVVVKYQHEKYGNWHRATITSVNMTNQDVNVYFVDWGGFATVSWSNVKLLTEQFTKMECQAIVVKLADVQRHNLEDPWPLEAINFLQDQILFENKCRMLVCTTDPLEVALFQVRPSADICLNSLLVENNHAVSTGNISDTLYWPNPKEIQVDDEDEDEFSYQLIKKAEAILTESEDSDLKDAVKQQVTVVQFESPDVIYVKFVKHRALEEEIHKELQIHYIARRKTQDTWKNSEYCVIFDAARNQYFRGIIQEKCGNDAYRVYLYDHVRDLKVPKHSIFIFDNYFKQYTCRVGKVRLGGIRPAGDRGKWSRLAIEILQKIFASYKIIHIKKIGMNTKEKKIAVLMWYGLSTPGKALEASKLNYVSINKVLLESGVAFGDHSAVSNSIDANKNHESEKQNDEEMEKKSISSDEEMKATGNCKNTQDWYQLICEDEEESIRNVLQSWPPPLALQHAEFDAVLTCVDSEGCFSIREEELHSFYLEMEAKLNSKLSSLQLISEKVEWRPSEMCTILFENSWYRAVVTDILDADEISVEMIDFGSEHIVKKNEVYKQIMFPDIPPFVNKVKLYDVYPKYGAWSANDVEELLQIVTDNIKVIIKDDLNAEIPAAEIYLESGLSVNDLITQKCPHLVRYENKVGLGSVDDEDNKSSEETENGEDSQEVDTMSVDGKSSSKSSDNMSNHNWGYTYAPIPELDNDKVKMMVLNVLKWKAEYNAVLKLQSDRNSQDLKTLNEEIQEQIEKQPRLDIIEVNEPCVCFHAQNNMWCRAIVYNIDDLGFGYVLAFFVDYGAVDMVSTQNVKVMKTEWYTLPVYNRIATIDIELVDSSKAEHVLMQMNNLRGKFATVEIISEDPFRVHLSDSKGLCYQNLINCGIIRAL